MRTFLELTIVGDNKKLYIPSNCVLTYEAVPEGKNPAYPTAGTFLRYDFGDGLSFAIVTEDISVLKEQVGVDGYLQLNAVDDAEMFIRKDLFVALQEKEDEGVALTQLSLQLGGKAGSIFVKNSFEEIKNQL